MKQFIAQHWRAFLVGIAGAAVAMSVDQAFTAIDTLRHPAPEAKIQPLFGNFGKEAGSDAADKLTDAIKSIKWPRRITAQIDFEYVGDPPTE